MTIVEPQADFRTWDDVVEHMDKSRHERLVRIASTQLRLASAGRPERAYRFRAVEICGAEYLVQTRLVTHKDDPGGPEIVVQEKTFVCEDEPGHCGYHESLTKCFWAEGLTLSRRGEGWSDEELDECKVRRAE
jgi:hypothetical protein